MMKPVRFFIIVLVLSVFVHGCKRADSPRVVTEKFMNHLLAGEFSKAKEYGTESTKQMMEMFEALESLGGETFANDSVAPEKIQNIECEVTGDTAICRFEQNGEMSEVTLVKIDGKWLVDLKKEAPFGEMGFGEEPGPNLAPGTEDGL